MTVKAGQKCTAIRRAIVPAAHRRRRSSRRSPRGWRRSPSATRRNADVRMGALASLGQRDEVRKAIEALRGLRRDRVRRPRPRRRRRRRRRARRLPLPRAAARARRARSSRTTSSRSARSARCSTYDDRRRGDRARRPRQGQPGRLAGHPRPRRRPRRHPRPRALARPDPGARPRRRRGVDRPRLAAADAGPRRPRPRRRRRGARRHPRRAAPHAAHRDPGLARHADRDHRPLDDRLAAHGRTTCTRSARAWPSCGSATPSRPAARTVTLGRHRPLRGVHRRHLLRPHRRGGRARTRCSAASSPTATSWSRWPPGLFVEPDPGPVLANFGVDHLRFLTPVKAGDTIR